MGLLSEAALQCMGLLAEAALKCKNCRAYVHLRYSGLAEYQLVRFTVTEEQRLISQIKNLALRQNLLKLAKIPVHKYILVLDLTRLLEFLL